MSIKPGDSGTNPFEEGWVACGLYTGESANFELLFHVPMYAAGDEEDFANRSRRPVTVAMQVARLLNNKKGNASLFDLNLIPKNHYVVTEVQRDRALAFYYDGEIYTRIEKMI